MCPPDAKDCRISARISIKDVEGFKESVAFKENRKTGRLDADDDNDGSARDHIWSDALLSDLKPLEGTCTYAMK